MHLDLCSFLINPRYQVIINVPGIKSTNRVDEDGLYSRIRSYFEESRSTRNNRNRNAGMNFFRDFLSFRFSRFYPQFSLRQLKFTILNHLKVMQMIRLFHFHSLQTKKIR